MIFTKTWSFFLHLTMRTSFINSLPEVRRNSWRRRAKTMALFSSYSLCSTSTTFPGKTPPSPQIKSLLQTSLRLTICSHTTLPLPQKWLVAKEHSTRFVSCKLCNYRYQQSAHFDKSTWKALTLIWSPRPGSPESLTWFVLIKPSITHREKEKKLPF